VIYCNNFSNLLPLSFVLGFFVNRVYSRFWDQLMLLPWPVKPAIYVSSYVRGRSEDSRMMRRAILRYLILSLVMTLSSISPQAKKRFPTLKHMTEAGKYTAFCTPHCETFARNTSFGARKNSRSAGFSLTHIFLIHVFSATTLTRIGE
jgi:hypothetical protein